MTELCCPCCGSDDIFFEPYGDVRTDGKVKYRDTINYCGYCGETGDFGLYVRLLVKTVKLEPTPLSPEEIAELEEEV